MAIKALALLVLFTGCKYSENNTPEHTKMQIDSLSNKWAEDSNGCVHARNKELALQLIKENKLMNETKEKFIVVFKRPNEVLRNGNEEILEYYFDNTCIENSPISKSEKCYAKFYFKLNRLAETDFTCE